MSRDCVKLLNQFNGKTDSQISDMLSAAVRHCHWDSIDGVNFVQWIAFLEWLKSPAGAEAIRIITLAFDIEPHKWAGTLQSEKGIRTRQRPSSLT